MMTKRVFSKTQRQEILKCIRKLIRPPFTGFLPYLYLYIDIIYIYIRPIHFFSSHNFWQNLPQKLCKETEVQVRKLDHGHIPSNYQSLDSNMPLCVSKALWKKMCKSASSNSMSLKKSRGLPPRWLSFYCLSHLSSHCHPSTYLTYTFLSVHLWLKNASDCLPLQGKYQGGRFKE